MPAPYLNDWNPVAKVAANTAMIEALAGGSIRIFNTNDMLLGEIALAAPVGTVNPTTGELVLVAAGDSAWLDSGTAAYATLYDGATPDQNPMQSLECQAGAAAVPGKCVLTTLATVEAKPFALVSWVLP